MSTINTATTGSVSRARRHLVAAIAAGAMATANADPFELQTHELDLHGVREVEAGDFARGIVRLKAQLGPRAQSQTIRTPILIDLCAAYVMANDLEQATQTCDKATASQWYAGLSHNNRGVLNIAKGRYEAAIADFERALEAGGARAVAERNLARARERLAAIQAQRNGKETLVADAAAGVFTVEAITLSSGTSESR